MPGPSPSPMSRRGFLAAGLASLVAACAADDTDVAERAPTAPATAAPTATSAPTAVPTPVPTPTPAIEPLAVPTGVLSVDPFQLGVASGDPASDSVILWTRLVGDPNELAEPVEVLWEVADDDTFTTLRATGVARAHPDLGNSLHIDPLGLEPDTRYAYRFRHGDYVSTVGRTRTLPAADSTPERLRFGFASCQDYEDGLYGGHRHAAEEDLDLFVWLGDYIYEYKATDETLRSHGSPEAFTLAEYRDRYALYKADPDLQAHHAACPWVAIWDDHEVENNYANAIDQLNGDPEVFLQRRFEAYQAWYEHMPVRLDPPTGPDWTVHRQLVWGDLLRLYLLDGRQYRDDQPTDGDELDVAGLSDAWRSVRVLGDGARDPERRILGSEQQSWLVEQASTSTQRWNVLAQQVLMHGLSLFPGQTPPLTVTDTWDGYHGHRHEVLDQLAASGASNIVVLTGDFHAASVGDLRADPYDYSLPVVATEFMAPPVASAFPIKLGSLNAVLIGANPQIKLFEDRNGYCVCDITPERWVTTFRFVDDVRDPGTGIETFATFDVTNGTAGARRT